MAYTAINKSSDYMDTKLYTQSGSNNNGNTQTLTMDNVGFVWVKNRDYTNSHNLFDIVRGGSKSLASDSTGAEQTVGGGITFGASDTTIGADTGGYGFNNRVGDDYVAFHWRTSGSQGSSNTDGSINTTYTSANTTSGFSICQWTGSGANATIGHGLGAVPKMYIVKNASATNDWNVYHHSIGNTHRLFLNTTQAAEDNASAWNDTSPTSSVFSVGTNTNVNQSGSTMIAYVFAEKTGFSKFGTYTGNGENDGPFCYTGFKPGFVLIKNADATKYWHIFDDLRAGYNLNNYRVNPNTNEVETTSTPSIDILSNGFKIRTSQSQFGNSNETHIFMAFAKAPLVGSNNTPVTTR